MTQIVILNLGLEQLEAPIVIRQSGAFSFYRVEPAKSVTQPAGHQKSKPYTENEHYACEYKQRREHGVR
jgi:hypothetical protein